MEASGAAFDVSACNAAAARAGDAVNRLSTEWYRQAPDVNPESPKQLSTYLYTTRSFPVPPVCGTLKAVKRTKRGERPTSEASLDWLLRKAQRPENKSLLATLMELRKTTKLQQFLTKLPSFCHGGMLYASFGPDTGTGRLSSRNPNLQNIPSATNDPFGIRTCFVAPAGYKLLVADYGALEPRILAHFLLELFDDHSLADALASGDMYAAVACRTWPEQLRGLDPTELKEHHDATVRKLRDYAKIIVLSSNYGKSVGGLALQLGLPADDAGVLLSDYFRAYPGIQRFQRWAYDQIGNGGVRTLLGRTREIDPGSTEYEQAKATRVATNTIIQGSAADVVYAAMVAQDRIKTRCAGMVLSGPEDMLFSRLQLQVHDELVWRVWDKFADEHAPDLIQCMESALPLKVPLKVSWKLCDNWAEGK